MGTNVFVFGSNEGGKHGAGSAEEAIKNHGAIWGQGVGRQGNSYAIPTKDADFDVLTISKIRYYVNQFIEYAREHPKVTFNVVKIGCGLAGFKESDIAPLFALAPANCILPEGWRS